MKIKTADLIGPALDWAVAKCEGLPLRRDPMGFKTGPQAGWWVWDGEGQNEIVGHRKTRRNQHDGIPDDLEDGELAWMLNKLADQMEYYMYAEPLK